MKFGDILSTLALFLFAGSAILPDTTPGSDRSIAVAVAGLLAIIGMRLTHAQGTAPAPQ